MDKTVLVVGDVIVDEYIYVETRRQAAEAAVPVWDEIRRESRPGGAWNVAKNIQSIDPEIKVYLAGILNAQRWHGELESKHCFSGDELLKRRYVHDGKIIFRHDDRLVVDHVEADLLRDRIYENTRHTVFDAVVYSDYNKGTLTNEIISYCNDLAELVVVDSKRAFLDPFARGRDCSTILKLNEYEWGCHASDAWPIESMFDHVVVTKGKDGATLRQFDGKESRVNRHVVHEEHFPTRRVWPVDVTGCGDTHTAAMTVALLRDSGVRNAVRFANEKASLAVQQFGTAVVK